MDWFLECGDWWMADLFPLACKYIFPHEVVKSGHT